jgi:hypothetical protein
LHLSEEQTLFIARRGQMRNQVLGVPSEARPILVLI